MWIRIENVNARVVKIDDKEREWLRGYLSFPDSRAFFRNRGGGGDNTICMFNSFNETFPAGFVSMVKKAGEAEGHTVTLVDNRRVPSFDPNANLAWLRDYQRAAFDAIVLKKRGIVWIPTGGGKTELLVALTRAIPQRWLFLVHRTTLGQQAADRFRRRNAEHGVDLGEPGVIGEGQWIEGEHLTCATFQTLSAALKKGDARARKLLSSVDGVAVDECHVLPADSFWAVAQACSAYYRVGLSGTPLARGDRRSVLAIATTGPVIYRIKSELLIKEGVLAKPKIRMVTVNQTMSPAATFQGVYGEKVSRSTVRNNAIVDIVKNRATKPCLIFVKELAHGKELSKKLWAAGVKNDFTSGKHGSDWRKGMVSKLVRGEIDALICSVIFQEGVDIPELRSVVNAGGSKSIIATLQKLGRGMRVERDAAGNAKPGADVFELYDVMDVGNPWLEKHSRARRNAYVSESFETIVEPAFPIASK
jgi:superfamily II DNA or RNA helicase